MAERIELTMSRVIRAPRELVWKAWTDGELLKRWSCPSGFVSESGESQPRVGGRWHVALRDSKGALRVARGEHREVDLLARLVMTHGWEDERGLVRQETVLTVELAEHADGTRMVMRQRGFESHEERDRHEQSWSECWRKLDALAQAEGRVKSAPSTLPQSLTVETPSDTTIVMTRAFRAPRELVWRAMVEPGMIRRWIFAPADWSMSVCEGEARVGAPFVWEWVDAQGRMALRISGVTLESKPPRRLAHTETMEAAECGVLGALVATIELDEHGAQTLMTMTLAFDSVQARDGALQSGMEQGMEAGYRSLDALLTPKA